jgi:hypothetical protein
MATTIIYGPDQLAETVETIAAARTLTASDSGKIFVLSAAGGAGITLPAPTAGLNFQFYVGALFATSNWVLTAPTAIFQGGAIVNSVNVPCAAKATVNFVSTADTVGDYVTLIADGTNYYVRGVGTAAGAITFV